MKKAIVTGATGFIGKYLVTDDDNAQGTRTGGFGSTNK